MADSLTLAATTAEQQAFELLFRLRNEVAEFQAAKPSTDLNGFEITTRLDIRQNQAIFSITLPLIQSNTIGGGLAFDALWVWGELPLLINGQLFTINGAPILI
jgi:hypothetical protein